MRLTTTHRQAFVSAVMNDVPVVDYSKLMSNLVEEEAVRQLPAKVRALWEDKKTRDYVRLGRAYFAVASRYISYPGVDDLVLPEARQAELAKLKQSSKAQDDKRYSLRLKLEAVAQACTTRKALVAALPEFEKYMPAEADGSCKTLPALANVVSAFVQAGWPKGGQ